MDPDTRMTHLVDQLAPMYRRLTPIVEAIEDSYSGSLTEEQRAIVIERQLTRLLGQDPDVPMGVDED